MSGRLEDEQIIADESEITINDTVGFIFKYRKILLIGAMLGCLVSLGATYKFGQYKAEAILVNRSGSLGTADHAIDFFAWNKLKNQLPMLADRLAIESKSEYFGVLSSDLWWKKNVEPSYSFSKENSKDVMGVTKAMQDAESTKIINFTLTATGSSKKSALENLAVATDFMRSGSAYLALSELVTAYQIDSSNFKAGVEKNMVKAKIELGFLKQRLIDIKALKSMYSGGSVNNQVVDLKDSGAKYLPISTQLVAASQDVNKLKEDLLRLQSKEKQLATVRRFLSLANPVLNKNHDGLSALREVMEIESNLRKTAGSDSLDIIQKLNDIKYDLTVIQTTFNVELEQPRFVGVRSPKFVKNSIIGLLGGAGFALMVAILVHIWLRYRATVVSFD